MNLKEEQTRILEKFEKQRTRRSERRKRIYSFMSSLMAEHKILLNFGGTDIYRNESAILVKDRRRQVRTDTKVPILDYLWGINYDEDLAKSNLRISDIEEITGSELAAYRSQGSYLARKEPRSLVTAIFVLPREHPEIIH